THIGSVGDSVLDGAALKFAAFALRKPAPDSESLVVSQRILKALGTDITGRAHLLGLTSRSSLLRKERFRVRLCAQCAVLPRERPFSRNRKDVDHWCKGRRRSCVRGH